MPTPSPAHAPSPDPDATPTYGPVLVKERLVLVDVLRGFAIFGILVANMATYSGLPRDVHAFTGLGFLITLGERFLIEAKFYSFFAFLFGWGMAVQLQRTQIRGVRFLPTYLRRLLVLLLFGFLHGVFIWEGDILALYALAGFVLLFFRRRSGKVLVLGIGVFLLLAMVMAWPGAGMDALREHYAKATAFLRSPSGANALFASGNYEQITKLRSQNFLNDLANILYYFGNVFAMMLLGLWVGKQQLLRKIVRSPGRARGVAAVGVVVGVVFNALFVAALLWPQRFLHPSQRFIAVSSRSIGAPALMLFYMAAILLLLQQSSYRPQLLRPAPVGRAALSNYLLQSLFATLLFYGYGLGYYGRIGPILALIITLAFFAVQIRLSEWWFERYRYGPAEWLWRSLTYGRWQPLRRLQRKARQPQAAPKWLRLAALLAVVLFALSTSWLHRQGQTGVREDVTAARSATQTPAGVQGAKKGVDTLVIATPVVHPVAYAPGPLAQVGDLQALVATFDPVSALQQIEMLTAPPYGGRRSASAGGQAAGDYLASEFARFGLQPAGVGPDHISCGRAIQVLTASCERRASTQPRWAGRPRKRRGSSGDEGAFLQTVDATVPHLLAEQQAWFASVIATAPTEFALSGRPLAFGDDNSLLAQITFHYRLPGMNRAADFRVPIRLTDSPHGRLWAGAPLLVAAGEGVTVFYQQAQEETAQSLLVEAQRMLPVLAQKLGVTPVQPLIIKLLADPNAFRSSVDLSFPAVDWAPAWTDAGQSIKLRLSANADPGFYRSILALQITRQLLAQQGVSWEWLLKGVSATMARQVDGGAVERMAANELSTLMRAQRKGKLLPLAAMPADHQLQKETFLLATVEAWDTVHYLRSAYGRQALSTLLAANALGASLDQALQAAIGLDQAGFMAAWSESLKRAHARPEWIEIAKAFDGDHAMQMVTELAQPAWAGRQAGSRGAEAAAIAIAERFADYGLLPAGDDGSYFQSVPITYTDMLALPSMVLSPATGEEEPFVYRQEFVIRLHETGGWGNAAGELLWLPGAIGKRMRFDGKILLMRSPEKMAETVQQARAQGAAGVIFVGGTSDKKKIKAKTPLPQDVLPASEVIPVVELSSDGYDHLLQTLGLTPPQLQNAPPALLLAARVQLSIPLREPTPAATANVLALLPGADPELIPEVIILGAHADHVGDDPGGLSYPGANDNASGVAVLAEIARLWHEQGFRPARSVLFAAWGAQELGEVGSAYFVAHPTIDLAKAVAMVQLDAVGGGSGYYLEVEGVREREGLMFYALQANEKIVKGRLKLSAPAAKHKLFYHSDIYVSPQTGTMKRLLHSTPSDQLSFLQAGIPALLVHWRGANEDNWPLGLADEVKPERLAMSGRMVSLMLMTLTQ